MNKATTEKIQKLRKKFSCDVYNTLFNDFKEVSMYEYSKKGLSLHSITGLCNINLIMNVLDKLSIPRGYRLTLEEQLYEDFGQFYFYIITPDGSKDGDIWNYIEVEESCMGAWQAYLLNTLWHVLPLYDHSNYCRRQFVFLDQDIEAINMQNKNPIEELQGLNIGLRVLQYESHYYISCCYWSDYHGMTRELVEIELKDGKVAQFFNVASKDVYVYEYGRNIRI